MAHGYRILQHWNSWLNSEMLGERLLQIEREVLTDLLKKYLGKHLVLVGVPSQLPLLQLDRIPVHTLISPLTNKETSGFYVESDVHELPILTGSVDMVIIPHTLQFIDRSRQLLNEACRIIKPEGLICILGFNPYSLWGLKKIISKSNKIPWSGNFIEAYNIKNWLQLADFQMEHHSTFLFRPPSNKLTTFNRCHLMESIGPKILPSLGGVYIILARAKVIPLTPIKMHWKQPLSGIRISTSITGHIARNYY